MSFLNKVTVEDLDVKGRRVLVRVDFNGTFVERVRPKL